jgi:hypothetical protein
MGRQDEEEEGSYYWMTLRDRKDAVTRNRKH